MSDFLGGFSAWNSVGDASAHRPLPLSQEIAAAQYAVQQQNAHAYCRPVIVPAGVTWERNGPRRYLVTFRREPETRWMPDHPWLGALVANQGMSLDLSAQLAWDGSL